MAPAILDHVAVNAENFQDEYGLRARFTEWVQTELVWYAGSFTLHLLGLASLLLLGGFSADAMVDRDPAFEPVKTEVETTVADFDKLADYDIGQMRIDPQPPVLRADPILPQFRPAAQKAEFYDESEDFRRGNLLSKEEGRGMGANDRLPIIVGGIGPRIGDSNVGFLVGRRTDGGGDDPGKSFDSRRSGNRKGRVAADGGTEGTERAVVGALIWLARHQMTDGSYYWYYATQVLHNMTGPDWDTWNRKMRRILIDSQCKVPGSCSNGSWAPENDPWGPQGGRVMLTALCCLTLEIYYRYLPLFKVDAEGAVR